MISEFKAGYTLFITSYLGDADYYNTEAVTGLTLEQAQLTERFLRRCISGYNFPNKSIYALQSDEIDLERVAKHFTPEELASLLKWDKGTTIEWNDELGSALQDLTYDLMGHGDPYTDCLRSFHSLEAVFFPMDVAMARTIL